MSYLRFGGHKLVRYDDKSQLYLGLGVSLELLPQIIIINNTYIYIIHTTNRNTNRAY